MLPGGSLRTYASGIEISVEALVRTGRDFELTGAALGGECLASGALATEIRAFAKRGAPTSGAGVLEPPRKQGTSRSKGLLFGVAELKSVMVECFRFGLTA